MNRSIPFLLGCILLSISYPGIAQNATGNEKEFQQYSRYNFIPGEKLIYSEDFSQDEIGDLPMGWNSSGKAEVITLEGMPGKWLKLFQNSNYLTSNNAAFPKNFTYEFDIIPQLKNTGYTFPLFNFGFLSSNDLSTTDNVLLDMPFK